MGSSGLFCSQFFKIIFVSLSADQEEDSRAMQQAYDEEERRFLDYYEYDSPSETNSVDISELSVQNFSDDLCNQPTQSRSSTRSTDNSSTQLSAGHLSPRHLNEEILHRLNLAEKQFEEGQPLKIYQRHRFFFIALLLAQFCQ